MRGDKNHMLSADFVLLHQNQLPVKSEHNREVIIFIYTYTYSYLHVIMYVDISKEMKVYLLLVV